MINRTKIIAITLTGALAAAALTGCGGSGQLADDEVQIGPFTVKVFGLDVDLCCIWSDVEVQ